MIIIIRDTRAIVRTKIRRKPKSELETYVFSDTLRGKGEEKDCFIDFRQR